MEWCYQSVWKLQQMTEVPNGYLIYLSVQIIIRQHDFLSLIWRTERKNKKNNQPDEAAWISFNPDKFFFFDKYGLYPYKWVSVLRNNILNIAPAPRSFSVDTIHAGYCTILLSVFYKLNFQEYKTYFRISTWYSTNLIPFFKKYFRFYVLKISLSITWKLVIAVMISYVNSYLVS